MPHYSSLRGTVLRDMLEKDGWEVEWVRNNGTHLKKGDKQLTFTLNGIIPKKRITSISQNKAGWSTQRFEELHSDVISSQGNK